MQGDVRAPLLFAAAFQVHEKWIKKGARSLSRFPALCYNRKKGRGANGVAKRDQALTAEAVEAYRTAVPALLKAAFYGDDLSACEVGIAEMGRRGAERLCCPLTPRTLRRSHRAPLVRRQDVDVVYVPDEAAERSGRLLFRVHYVFDGDDAAGKSFAVQQEAVMAVSCCPPGTSPFRRALCIEDVTPCTGCGGRIVLPETSSRRSGREWAGRVGSFCLEALGEIILEGIFEFIGDLLDGI